jgi:hypothetical protein
MAGLPNLLNSRELETGMNEFDRRRFAILQGRVAQEMVASAEALTRERHADARLERFRNSVTGAGVSLSQPATQSEEQRSNSASLSERRDTTPGTFRNDWDV